MFDLTMGAAYVHDLVLVFILVSVYDSYIINILLYMLDAYFYC